MGINSKAYAAQTSSSLMTTTGQIAAVMYELDVGVYKKQLDPANPQLRQHSTIVSSDQPICPTEVDILGGTMPVSVHRLHDPALATDLSTVDDAWESPWGERPRLSGMLPFMVCYMSSAPGNNLLWLGEDRVDVLGSDRLPGQLRYRALLDDNREPRKSMETGHEDWMAPGGNIGALNKVTFEHVVIGGGSSTMREDYGEGKSFILVGSQGVDLSNVGPPGLVAVPQGAGGGTNASVWRFVINPRDRPGQRAAIGKRTERAERERKRQERRQANTSN